MSKNTGYTAYNERTERFCKAIGFNFECKFVSTFKRKDTLFVKPTLGKENEFAALRKACDEIKMFEGLRVVYAGNTKMPQWAL